MLKTKSFKCISTEKNKTPETTLKTAQCLFNFNLKSWILCYLIFQINSDPLKKFRAVIFSTFFVKFLDSMNSFSMIFGQVFCSIYSYYSKLIWERWKWRWQNCWESKTLFFIKNLLCRFREEIWITIILLCFLELTITLKFWVKFLFYGNYFTGI